MKWRFIHVALRITCAVVLAVCSSAMAMAEVSEDKDWTNSIPQSSVQRDQGARSGLKGLNLAIYGAGMWLVLRYDAQANSLVATGSDKDGPALWFAKSVQVVADEDDELTLKAIAVLKFGTGSWVDWQQFEVKMDAKGRATIIKTNPNGTYTYRGRAVKVRTYGSNK